MAETEAAAGGAGRGRHAGHAGALVLHGARGGERDRRRDLRPPRLAGGLRRPGPRRLAAHRRRRPGAGAGLRPPLPAGAQGGRAVRLHPRRLRRLHRVPHRLGLLDRPLVERRRPRGGHDELRRRGGPRRGHGRGPGRGHRHRRAVAGHLVQPAGRGGRRALPDDHDGAEADPPRRHRHGRPPLRQLELLRPDRAGRLPVGVLGGGGRRGADDVLLPRHRVGDRHRRQRRSADPAPSPAPPSSGRW